MTTRQSIATADEVFAGRGYENALYTLQLAKGRPVNFLTKYSLGTPVLAVTDGIIKAATLTELPNATTITYTPSSTGSPVDATSPLTEETIATVDGNVLVWVLDTPRNITAGISNTGGTIVATTITITGYDRTRNKIVKTLSLTGSSAQTGATTATFKYIKSIAIYSASDSTGNVVNVGFGDVLGLPFRLASKTDMLKVFFDGAADDATIVPAVTSTVSATSGDTRGTIDCAGTLDGTKDVTVWFHVSDSNAASRAGLLGITQYAG